MKLKSLYGIALAILSVNFANADIVVNLPADCSLKTIDYYYAPIQRYAAAKTRSDRGIVADSVQVKDSKAVIGIPDTSDSYLFGLKVEDNGIDLYAIPGENLEVDITSCKPFNYTMRGSLLLEGISQPGLDIRSIRVRKGQRQGVLVEGRLFA